MADKISYGEYHPSDGIRITAVGLEVNPQMIEASGYELFINNRDKIPKRYRNLAESPKEFYSSSNNRLNHSKRGK